MTKQICHTAFTPMPLPFDPSAHRGILHAPDTHITDFLGVVHVTKGDKTTAIETSIVTLDVLDHCVGLQSWWSTGALELAKSLTNLPKMIGVADTIWDSTKRKTIEMEYAGNEILKEAKCGKRKVRPWGTEESSWKIMLDVYWKLTKGRKPWTPLFCRNFMYWEEVLYSMSWCNDQNVVTLYSGNHNAVELYSA